MRLEFGGAISGNIEAIVSGDKVNWLTDEVFGDRLQPSTLRMLI